MTDGTDMAYPVPAVPGMPNGDVMWGQPGITKRELFAAMAMQGLVLYRSEDGQEPPQETIAAWAVQQADALIEALNKQREMP